MFKGTNMMWKSIALVLVLCMSFSTMVAFADGTTETPAGNTVDITTDKAGAEAKYNEDGTVTIAGTFGDNTCTADVTILAVRDTAEQTLDVVGGKEGVTGAWSAEKLKQQVIYIDQEAAVAGAFSFTFIPKTGVSGGTITVFVGGEDAANVDVLSFTGKTAGPELVAAGKWYEGQPLVLNVNSASNGGAYGGTDETGAMAKWFADVASITVTTGAGDVTVGKEVVDNAAYAVPDYANCALTIHGLGLTGVSVSAITTTSTSSDWKPASLKAAVAQEKKVAGTLATDKSEYVVGETIDFIGTGEDTAWNDAVDANVYAKVSETALAADAIDTVGTTTATLSDPTTVLEETYWAAVKADYYTPSNVVSYTVKAPALVKAEAVTDAEVKVAYSAATADDDATTTTIMGTEGVTTPLTGDNIALYGAAEVALPTAPAGYSYTWTITQPEGQGAVLPADLTGASITLDRPNYDATNVTAKSYTYTLKLTVADTTNTTWKAAEKTFTLSATRVGMKGVPVAAAPSFGSDATASAKIAANATAKLTGAGGNYDLTWDATTSSFKAEAIAPGEYTITVVRPGYLVGTATIEVQSDGTISGALPTMIAGDTDGSGLVDILDVSEIVNNWSSTTDIATDLDGSGLVDILDVSVVVNNWNASGVGTDSLE